MGYIKNFDAIATSPARKLVLDLVEAALDSIQFKTAVEQKVTLNNSTLTILDQHWDLDQFDRVFVIGFGKGSAEVCLLLEQLLGDRLTQGWDIDVVSSPAFQKINYTQGTHPLPSQANLDFTRQVLDQTQELTDRDLVLVVICGGGSALFETPAHLTLDRITQVNEHLVKSGATITEMNVVRKHVSAVKGGKLAQHLYPATIASLIFSDVPGNDLTTIASGPTTQDSSTMADVQKVLTKYQLQSALQLSKADFTETPQDSKYFSKVSNILVVSNQSALETMQQLAQDRGVKAVIYSDKIQGDAHVLGQQLLDATQSGQILLAGGESTIKVTHKDGKGGRNQALALAVLPQLTNQTIVCAFDSDGWDFYGLAGALADHLTLEQAQRQNLDPVQYLTQDDSYDFWQKVGDGLDTGKLESNVADLIIVYKPDPQAHNS